MRSGFPQPCTGASYWMVPHLCEQGNQKQQQKLQQQQKQASKIQKNTSLPKTRAQTTTKDKK